MSGPQAATRNLFSLLKRLAKRFTLYWSSRFLRALPLYTLVKGKGASPPALRAALDWRVSTGSARRKRAERKGST